MLDPLLITFIGVVTLITITPGADMALAAAVTFRHGPRLGTLSGWGACVGLLVHGLAAAVGLSAILVGSALLFSIVKIVGGIYLLYLGARLLWEALRAGRPASDAADALRPPDGRLTPARAFGRGVLTNILNPKIAVFYLAFLPQFAQPGEPFFARAILLAAIHAVIGAVWLALYTHALARAGRILRAKGQRIVEGATGSVLMLLGMRLLVEKGPRS